MRGTLWYALTIVLPGCGSGPGAARSAAPAPPVPSVYTEADLAAPTVVVSGKWCLAYEQENRQVPFPSGDGVVDVDYVFEQEKDKVRAFKYSWSPGHSNKKERLEGAVTGRVLRLDLPKTLQTEAVREIFRRQNEFLFSADGKTARCRVGMHEGKPIDMLYIPAPSDAVERALPAASTDPRCPKDPALADALLLHGRGGAKMDVDLGEYAAKLIHVREAESASGGEFSRTVLQAFRKANPGESPEKTIIAAKLAVISLKDPSQVLHVGPEGGLWYQSAGHSINFTAVGKASFLEARARSPFTLKRSGSFEGKPCWWVVAPMWEDAAKGLTPTKLVAELYREDPDSGALPVDLFEVGRRRTGEPWRGDRYWLKESQALTSLGVSFENDLPKSVDVVEVGEPPLEDFLVAKEADVETARWRNRVLVLAKNRTLPKMLGTLKTADLKALVDRIELLILDVNREMERRNDEAQRALAAGKPQAGQTERDLAILYKERTEILKPVLAAVKEEVSNREK